MQSCASKRQQLFNTEGTEETGGKNENTTRIARICGLATKPRDHEAERQRQNKGSFDSGIPR